MKRKLPEALRLSLAALALATAAAAAQAPGDVRIALVIGNAAYASAPVLANPTNDADAIGATLRTLGFTVIEVKDGSRAQMAQAIASVREALKGKQAIGMLYYAGHGLQVDFRNYMVPVDAKIAGGADVARQTIDVGEVIDAFKAAGNRMNIVVLDACRENPFAGGTAKGLAPLDAPTGTFLAYATAPGNVAEDGDVGAVNGLYTGYLVKELQKPAARIEDVFKRVRLQVRQHSKGRQIPWESTSLEEDFFFNDGARYTFRAEDLQRLSEGAKAREQLLRREAEQGGEQSRRDAAAKALDALKAQEAQRLQELATAAEQARGAERLKRMSAERAREESFRAEKEQWDRIKDTAKVDDVYAFLQRYPNGFLSEQAQSRLERLQQAQVRAQVAPGGAQAMLAPGARRFYEGDEIVQEVTDGFTKNSRTVNLRVTRATADRVEFNNGEQLSDQAGTVLKNPFGTHEPGILAAPDELFVGKHWKTAYETTRPDGVRETAFWNFKVTALEDVTVPIGTFKAYRIDGTGEARTANGSFTTLTGSTWIDPATMLALRVDRLNRNNGRIIQYFTNVIRQRKLVPRPS